MYALPLVFVALIAGQVSASSGFTVRQSSDAPTVISLDNVPERCKTPCAGAVNVLTTCKDINDTACLCNANVQSSMVACLQCGLNGSTDATLLSAAQKSIDKWEDACNSSGANLPHKTISDASSNSTGASPSGAASGSSNSTSTDKGSNGASSVVISSGAVVGAVLAAIIL